MRGKRAKQYRKLMHQYQHTFNFREPYQVLVDAEIIQDAARFTMDLVGGLKRTLQGEVKPMITQCSMRYLYSAKPKNEELITQAKRYERRRCNHHELEEPLSALECISEVVDPKSSGTNRHRYVVATQDKELRAQMREKLGVPLVYINRSVMILEPMAAESGEVREREERNKFRAGLAARPSKTATPKRKRDDESMDQEGSTQQDGSGADTGYNAPTRKKRRGPKEPNPLSVKKSQKKSTEGQHRSEKKTSKEGGFTDAATIPGDTLTKKKRRRKHKHAEKPEEDNGSANEMDT